MGYNTSRACVHRQLKYLTDMLGSKSNLPWPSKDPVRDAQAIREAMHAALHYPEFSHFHHLCNNWRIRAKERWVLGEYIGPPADLTITHATPSITVREATDYLGAAGACIRFSLEAEEIHFPNVHPDKEQLLSLYNWGLVVEDGPPWHLIYHDDEGITMTRREEAKDFFWKPEE
jgi:hypothetical protein